MKLSDYLQSVANLSPNLVGLSAAVSQGKVPLNVLLSTVAVWLFTFGTEEQWDSVESHETRKQIIRLNEGKELEFDPEIVLAN